MKIRPEVGCSGLIPQMNQLSENSISCPYCGEWIEVLVETFEDEQQYIEDCQVCCRPILFKVSTDDNGKTIVDVSHEDETY